MVIVSTYVAFLNGLLGFLQPRRTTFAWGISTQSIPKLVPLPPKKGGSDLTAWLVAQSLESAFGPVGDELREEINSNNPFGYSGAIARWANLVRTESTWDFKPRIIDDFGEIVTLGGHEVTYEAVANIHYGFVGASIGLSTGLLRVGAGAAQLIDHPNLSQWATLFDGPHDQAAIMFGVSLYQRFGRQLTVNNFTEAIQSYYQFLTPDYWK